MRKLLVLCAMLVGISPAFAQTITLNPSTTYQTMRGWEVQNEGGEERSDFSNFQAAVLQKVVDAGINRIRLEVRSGAENPTDSWTVYKNAGFPHDGGAANLAWRAKRYETINDNSDPNVIDQSKFQWVEIDDRIDKFVNPLRTRLAAQGESLYVNLNYVSFYGQVTSGQPYLHSNSAEYAEFMLALFQHIKTKYGWVPNGIEIMLEPDNTTTWNATLVGQAITATGAKLAAAGFTPDFIAPSNQCMDNAITYYSTAKGIANQSSWKIKELSYHRYCGVSTQNLQTLAANSAADGIGTSMLEMWDPFLSPDVLHEAILTGNGSAWQQAAMVDFVNPDAIGMVYVNPATPTVATFTSLTKTTSLYYNAARMNAVRIGATSTDSTNASPIAWRNADGRFAVVTKTSGGATLNFVGLPAGTYRIKYTLKYSNTEGTQADSTITTGQTLTTSIPNVGTISVVATAPPAGSPPTGEAIVNPENLTYLGKFFLPGYQELDYYVTGVAGVDGNDMLFTCKDLRPGKVAIMNIPALGGTATMKVPCTAITNIELINPSDPNKKIVSQGFFAPNGTDVYVMAYSYYDGNNTQSTNVFKMSRATLGSQTGPFRVGSATTNMGLVTGYTGTIPAAWRTLLGYDTLVGQCCLAIIGRSSQGPSASGINIADIVSGTANSEMFVGYPNLNGNCGVWTTGANTTPCYSAADVIGGVVWIPGTSSPFFVGRHGTAPKNCYGYGTLDPNLVGTFAQDGEKYCLDSSVSKGPKTYPYLPQIWRYKATDLLAVKNGVKQPYEILPDLMWNFGIGSPLENNPSAYITSAVYDIPTKRLYVSANFADEVLVWGYNGNAAPPPPVEICGDGIDNDGDGLIDEGCDIGPPPPLPPTLTFNKTVTQCRIVVNSDPPDNTGGWSVQFKWISGTKSYNFGASDSSAPYTKTRIFNSGAYGLTATWSKTGQTTLTTAVSTFNCS